MEVDLMFLTHGPSTLPFFLKKFYWDITVLKFQYFVHLMQRVDSLKKTDAGRDWGQEEKGRTEDEMAGWHHRLNGHEFRELVMDREAWRAAVHRVTKNRT